MRMMEFLSHIGFWPALGGQLLLTAGTFLLAVAIGFPLGLLAYRYRVLTPPMIGFANFLKILPGFAVFGILMAMGRHSTVTSLLAALFFTILPVIFGTEKGFRRIGRPPIDAALGMGMDPATIFVRVLLPLASPQVMAGLRRAGVAAVGMVTLATMRGGGLGALILEGIRQNNGSMTLAGALPACLLALIADLALAWLFRLVVPAPLRRREKRVLYIAK